MAEKRSGQKPNRSSLATVSERIDAYSSSLTSAGYTTAVSVSLVLTGGIGSVWSHEIGQAFPLAMPAGPTWDICWRAVIFWLLFVVSAVLLFLRQRGTDVRRNKAEARLTEGAERLEDLIRTTPPRHFLEISAALFNKSAKFLEAGENCTDSEEIPQLLVRQLRILATLVQEFDGRPKDEEYSTHIMLYRGMDSLRNEDEQKNELRKRMKPFANDLALSSLQGFLELCPTLSARAAKDSEQPGPPEIVLPVPMTPKSAAGYCVLPGAPLAWWLKDLFVCTNTDELPEWCERQNFKPGDIAGFRCYLREQKQNFQSFASIPLFQLDKAGEDDKSQNAMAVLNVQRKSPGLLGGRFQAIGEMPLKDHQQGFLFIARPFIVVLVKLLSRYIELGGHATPFSRRSTEQERALERKDSVQTSGGQGA